MGLQRYFQMIKKLCQSKRYPTSLLEVLAVQLKNKLEIRDRADRQQHERPELPQEIKQDLEAYSIAELENSFKVFRYEISQNMTETRGQGPEASIKSTLENSRRQPWKPMALYPQNTKKLTECKTLQAEQPRFMKTYSTSLKEKTRVSTLKNSRRLAVYENATGKQQEREARTSIAKAFRLLASIRAYEDEEYANKDMAFDAEMVQRIEKARQEQQLIRAAINNRGGYGHGGGRGRACFDRASGWNSTRGPFTGIGNRESNIRGRFQ
ncbi:hypothetical protein BDB00DRAFT_908628 [Zychaea mexicana]|uniref:uncharacterized protein n=1 Tax=Zychaea mexicana TaxID=64656 RepID=UPI0022FF2207|nr:uncharacterized protein BDB00DRAFT_908628 [Zychaea mexicana]KAI9493047.1 hypothetical protein BDB00DRAFT_908628 [Zychaea mexicana]